MFERCNLIQIQCYFKNYPITDIVLINNEVIVFYNMRYQIGIQFTLVKLIKI